MKTFVNHNESVKMLNRNFALEAVRVTEHAAIKASAWIGRGECDDADQAAVNAMRESLNQMDIDGTIVIGEGERDKAPMLYIGEKVGNGNGPEIDIALDPLEGTNLCATGSPNALAVIAFAKKGCFLHAPDVYMDKIAVGPGLPEGIVDLDSSVKENLANLAKAKKCDVSDLTVVILERDRHSQIIADVRAAGSRIHLISDGDIAGIISVVMPNPSADLYIGTGGAPEGVLAAAALGATGGQMLGRLIFHDDVQRERAKRMGITDLDKKYKAHEMARGDVMFSATGVTDGFMLRGVKHQHGSDVTHSIVMRSATGTVRTIKTTQRRDI
ncbi:MAG: class II fructose-bisphosphatase [Rickettsiales bacterium]|jgi:fructose-1,6-bisphosphatase II / sedoheptulose-1,7-bisphosphatase|nr:class II fructose-bisphosphatase [Rickettsiales bacterium]